MELPSLLFLSALLVPALRAEEPTFESHLFTKGTLIYSDDFDDVFDRERWEPDKSWEVKDSTLVGKPDYASADEAKKAV